MIPALLLRAWPALLVFVAAALAAGWLLHAGAERERMREMERQSEAARKADEASRDYRHDGGAAGRLRDGTF
jgi:hypothetical protein